MADTKWKPGVSGNPGGRPVSAPFDKHFKKAAALGGEEAVHFLRRILRGDEFEVRIDGKKVMATPELSMRQQAAVSLLAFVPKPKTEVEVTTVHRPEWVDALTVEQVLEMGEKIETSLRLNPPTEVTVDADEG